LYNLILDGNYKKELPFINELLDYSGKILQRVDEISCLLEEVVNKTKKLEAKAVSDDILQGIGLTFPNQNP
jgi:hypothetical protein